MNKNLAIPCRWQICIEKLHPDEAVPYTIWMHPADTTKIIRMGLFLADANELLKDRLQRNRIRRKVRHQERHHKSEHGGWICTSDPDETECCHHPDF